MRNQEMIAVAKEQLEELKTIDHKMSLVMQKYRDEQEYEKENIEFLQESYGDELFCEDIEEEGVYELLSPEVGVAMYVRELIMKMSGALEVFIENENTGEHQAKRTFKSCISDIRRTRVIVEKDGNFNFSKPEYFQLLYTCERICRKYIG